MTKENFIYFIEDLGFNKTSNYRNNGSWESVYSIFPDGLGLFQPKGYISFIFEGGQDCIRLYYNKEYSGDLGFFPIRDIGDFEKIIIVETFSKYFNIIPQGFKEFIRDIKISQIL